MQLQPRAVSFVLLVVAYIFPIALFFARDSFSLRGDNFPVQFAFGLALVSPNRACLAASEFFGLQLTSGRYPQF